METVVFRRGPRENPQKLMARILRACAVGSACFGAQNIHGPLAISGSPGSEDSPLKYSQRAGWNGELKMGAEYVYNLGNMQHHYSQFLIHCWCGSAKATFVSPAPGLS